MDFDQLFPDNRQEGETPIRQCQLVMLGMLKIFDYLCEKHNISYFLIGGSLLGAIRHKGFIPWDDDLDVGMTRKDYEKFVKYVIAELPNDIFFQNQTTDVYYPKTSYVDARLRDKYSSYFHLDDRKRKWHHGLQLDIFVHDRSYLPHNFFIITQNKLFKLLKDNNRRAKLLKLISRFQLLPLAYASNYLHHFSNLKYGNFIKEKELYPLVKTRFEDMEAYIPQKFDIYLKRQYGNYMQLPPEEKRLTNHNVKADPFKPCDHKEILHWDKRKVINEL